MKVLFTGGSSFTGCWFIRELARKGHEVVAAFRERPEDYAEPLRRRRVVWALERCRGVHGCSFGDAQFVELAGSEDWDIVCHHASDVTNYRSADFDVAAALRNNTRSIGTVLERLRNRSGTKTRLLVTGSVFENDEGAGSDGLPAFSPYGLSKSFTHQVFRYHAARNGLALGKFVIANPFGPYEEPRFTAYLMKTWFAGKSAAVNTPEYVRDNIHVSLLAKAYVDFAEVLLQRTGLVRLNPSGYIESQGAFAQRFAHAMRERLGLGCELELKAQADFPEPRVRTNTDAVDGARLGWNEKTAWDEIARFYEGEFSAK
jgi:UDP-glucose 4-epimerase